MKLWKKISAMTAMAAMCVSLAVSAAASAEEVNARIGGCAGECNWTEATRDDVEYIIDRHTYDNIIQNPGGTIHHQEEKCNIEYVKKTYFKYCTSCGITKPIRCEYFTRHTKCGKK